VGSGPGGGVFGPFQNVSLPASERRQQGLSCAHHSPRELFSFVIVYVFEFRGNPEPRLFFGVFSLIVRRGLRCSGDLRSLFLFLPSPNFFVSGSIHSRNFFVSCRANQPLCRFFFPFFCPPLSGSGFTFFPVGQSPPVCRRCLTASNTCAFLLAKHCLFNWSPLFPSPFMVGGQVSLLAERVPQSGRRVPLPPCSGASFSSANMSWCGTEGNYHFYFPNTLLSFSGHCAPPAPWSPPLWLAGPCPHGASPPDKSRGQPFSLPLPPFSTSPPKRVSPPEIRRFSLSFV